MTKGECSMLYSRTEYAQKKKPSPWILDSGASNHITSDLQHLCNVTDVSGCPVGLLNGHTAISTKEGKVKLSDNLNIEHVLYVPQFKCNLISISQLSYDSNYSVQFTDDLCAIEDRTSKMLIGSGERRNELYLFREAPSNKVCKVEGMNELEV
ncbi:PREDICTED: uncharacterized protein LOC109329316 [Lupinus angustifolius]|uniref:uncharacterized protein LOC109329316 n=1 Tax=Lupinus angustifolius TaxID=3871 RepID=UPI00092FA614|nr:PREDICTED: uncharacterized protein LOC109329316 [Lupinus angustifolius]